MIIYFFIIFVCAYINWCAVQICKWHWSMEEGIKFPGTGVSTVCEPQCGCWKYNSESSELSLRTLKHWDILSAFLKYSFYEI